MVDNIDDKERRGVKENAGKKYQKNPEQDIHNKERQKGRWKRLRRRGQSRKISLGLWLVESIQPLQKNDLIHKIKTKIPIILKASSRFNNIKETCILNRALRIQNQWTHTCASSGGRGQLAGWADRSASRTQRGMETANEGENEEWKKGCCWAKSRGAIVKILYGVGDVLVFDWNLTSGKIVAQEIRTEMVARKFGRNVGLNLRLLAHSFSGRSITGEWEMIQNVDQKLEDACIIPGIQTPENQGTTF